MIFHIVILVLLILLLAALSTLTHLSRRNIPSTTPADPARLFHRFYNLTIYLYLATTSLSVLATALALAEFYIWSTPLYAAAAHISSIAVVLGIFSVSLLLQTIARLAIGLRVACSTNGSYASSKFIKTISVLTVGASVAWVLWWIERQVHLARYWRGDDVWYYNNGGGRGAQIANFVFGIIGYVGYAMLLVAGITVLVYAVGTSKVVTGAGANKGAAAGGLRGIAKWVVAVASVNLLAVVWLITGGVLFGASFGRVWVGWWDLIDMFVVKYAMLAVLWVVYSVAKKREGGLWLEGSGRESGEAAA